MPENVISFGAGAGLVRPLTKVRGRATMTDNPALPHQSRA
jgi:hypothetical protein